MFKVLNKVVRGGAIVGAASVISLTPVAMAHNSQYSNNNNWNDNNSQDNDWENHHHNSNMQACEDKQQQLDQRTEAYKQKLQAKLDHLNDVYAGVLNMGFSESNVDGYNNLKDRADNAQDRAQNRIDAIHSTDLNCGEEDWNWTQNQNHNRHHKHHKHSHRFNNESIQRAKQAVERFENRINDLFQAILNA